ncbi:MAG TPA: hypothetical protein VMR98_04400 [Candidatus Polarisedimenticolaceae bacterium]|nr:hypothetical protein [Candidatus Polarisedimenticolaceae bacterium]
MTDTDWLTIASLATAAGTLVLAVATFASVRSANRSARVSERALLGANLPLVVPSRLSDPPEKIRFLGDRWIKIRGGHAYAEATDTAIFLAIAVRNTGRGMALLDQWSVATDDNFNEPPASPKTFRRLTRDLYIAPGDTGFWQGAIRDTDDGQFKEIRTAIAERRTMRIDVEYADQEGGQRTISRIGLTPVGKADWIATIARHWRLDGTSLR